MNLKFRDTHDAMDQEYFCSILASLSLLSDAYRRSQQSNGVVRSNFVLEMKFHYQLAIRTVLRMLHVSSNESLAIDKNIERLMEKGMDGFEDFIAEYGQYLDLEKDA